MSSSNSLFHFTNHFKDLESILESKFFVANYCLESNDYFPEELETYIPMVSFCDILLKDIREHISKYGSYGIAMKREWGESMQLNPIIYPHKNSNYTSLLRDILSQSQTNNKLNDYGKQLALEAGIILMTLTKPFNGKMYRKDKGYLYDVKFYDEKEWRYIPFKFRPLVLIKKDTLNYEKEIKPYNDFLKTNHQLKFTYEDIKYIIVATKNDKDKMIEKYGNSFDIYVWEIISKDI